jgi:acetyl esterase/lipase
MLFSSNVKEDQQMITKDMCLRQIAELPEFAPMRDQFIASRAGDSMHDKYDLTLFELQEKNPTWFWKDLLFGIARLYTIATDRKQYVYNIERDVSLVHMPANNKTTQTYAILMAGGAYGAVCTMVEAMPVAAKLNELGMDCFCLNYRTATADDLTNGLMPKPLEDVATAWRFIKENEATFGLRAEDYLAGGFSAGGHLAAMWGTPNQGARSYGLPNPKLLLLAYPVINRETMDGPTAKLIGEYMFGANYNQNQVREYAANHHVDADYPPVFLVQAMDDDVVPIEQSYCMENALQKAKIPHLIEHPATGGHGFGLGSATPATGWPERELAFMETICSSR